MIRMMQEFLPHLVECQNNFVIAMDRAVFCDLASALEMAERVGMADEDTQGEDDYHDGCGDLLPLVALLRPMYGWELGDDDGGEGVRDVA